MRYPSRLLTDPQQRAFSHTARRDGGVIVIDQSGSMDVTSQELERLLRSAPQALVVGYSHRRKRPHEGSQTPSEAAPVSD